MRRTIGTFDSQNHAAIANEIARNFLKTEKFQKVTDAQVKQNIKLARAAAWNAVLKMDNPINDVQPDSEDMLDISLMLDEIQHNEARYRPKLLSSPLQSETVRIFFIKHISPSPF